MQDRESMRPTGIRKFRLHRGRKSSPKQVLVQRWSTSRRFGIRLVPADSVPPKGYTPPWTAD